MSLEVKIALIFVAAYVCLTAITGCTTPIPDSTICVEVDISRARCTTIMTGKNYVIDETHKFGGKTYWEIRPEMILVPAQSWLEIKEFILKICNQSHMCSDNVGNWATSVQTVSDEIDSKSVGAP